MAPPRRDAAGLDLTLYVDGQQAATGVASGTVRRSAGMALVAGRPSWTSSSGLVGQLDDVAVYDRALAGAELAAHADAGIDRTAPERDRRPAAQTDATSASFALSSAKARVTYRMLARQRRLHGLHRAHVQRAVQRRAHAAGGRTDRWGLASPTRTYSWTVDPKAATDYTATAPSTSSRRRSTR